jgi:hypothetical protein
MQIRALLNYILLKKGVMVKQPSHRHLSTLLNDIDQESADCVVGHGVSA